MFGNYTGTQKIAAAYAMFEFSPLRKLDVIAGVRFESTRMDVVAEVEEEAGRAFVIDDWLPSVNLVYHLQQNMNLRGAFGMTLARPTLREMAPFGSWEFLNDYIFVGNPNLHRTLIYNYDLRWEWFTKPGEVLAVSAFYKKFIDPVEKILVRLQRCRDLEQRPGRHSLRLRIRSCVSRWTGFVSFAVSR